MAIASALKTCLAQVLAENDREDQDTEGFESQAEDDSTARQLLLGNAEASEAGSASSAEEGERGRESSVDEAAQVQAQEQQAQELKQEQQQQQQQQTRPEVWQQWHARRAARQQQQQRLRRQDAASRDKVQGPAASKHASKQTRIIAESGTDGEADAENSPAAGNGSRGSRRRLQQQRAEEQQLRVLRGKLAELDRRSKRALAKKQRHEAMDLLAATLKLADQQVGHLEVRPHSFRHRQSSGCGSEESADEAVAQPGTAADASPVTARCPPYAIITGEWEQQQPIQGPGLSFERLMREGCPEKPEGSRGTLLLELPDHSYRRLSMDYIMRYFEDKGMLHAIPDVKREDLSNLRPFVEVGETECHALLLSGEELHVTTSNKNLTTVAELAEVGLPPYPKRIQRNSVLLLVDQLALQAQAKGQGIRESAAAGGKPKLVGGITSVHTVTFCGMEGAQPEEPLAFVARPSSQGPNKGMPVLHAGPLARSAVRSDLREALLGLQCCAPLAEAALYSAVEYMVVEQDGQSVWDGMKKEFTVMVASFDFHGTMPEGTPALVERDLLMRLREPTPAARALLAQQAVTKARRDALGTTSTLEWSEPRVASAQAAAEAVGKLAAAITTDPAREGAGRKKMTKATFK